MWQPDAAGELWRLWDGRRVPGTVRTDGVLCQRPGDWLPMRHGAALLHQARTLCGERPLLLRGRLRALWTVAGAVRATGRLWPLSGWGVHQRGLSLSDNRQLCCRPHRSGSLSDSSCQEPPMDGSRFDAVARTLTTAGSRRRAVAGVLAGALGFL
jgi:hypothetical protein